MHDVIIHQENFVDPKNARIHTQNIESMWSRAKRIFRHIYSTSWELFEHYLVELWRSKFKANQFGNILCQIAEQYPV